MKSVAENLKPPFLAVIMLDIIEADIDDGPSPSDEMLSIAPVQEGFLGLETTNDKQGRWISVSYWQDEGCFARWRKLGETHVSSQFGGLKLDNACKFRLTKVDDHALTSKPLIANARAVRSSAATFRIEGLSSKIFNAFPAIAGLFGYEHAR